MYNCIVHRKTGQLLRLKRKKKKKNWGNAYAALISAIQTSTILGSFPQKKKKKNFILGVQIMDLKWF